MKRCFPRLSKFWIKRRDLELSTYFNVLKYAGSSVDQDILYLTYGGFLVKNGEHQECRIGKEASMAYSLGLYLESFHHDDPKLFMENVKKNIKMRLAPPIVFVKGELFDESIQQVPVVCCGYSEDALLIVNPKTGEEQCITIESCIRTNGQWEMIMLNVPGMSKITDVSIKFSVQSAVSYYLKRFNAAMVTKKQEQLLKNIYMSQGNLQQLKWLEIAEAYQELLTKETRTQLQAMAIYYETVTRMKGEIVV
ncbi:hypothetical protein [Candidatus Enterococcus mansonii]|uniref:Uncharacterized protein n=1 Tax=Candidatus Enterococcus mansonii TaxID=1834181 RepID=A0A242CCP8_9ENTE|nr:hypothetical protein [Enterococcus sp. 4G2_DIV0659]OTO07939.1 hypothetical protein A5880_002209 [Enterococcus sp. 4G2_DIV0659]